MTTVLEATLKTGEKVYSEFDKLTKVGDYSAAVFAGRKPFNCWTNVANVHPHSGERVLIRERLCVNGTEIRSIRQVKLNGNGEYEGVPTVKSGERGVWTAPSNPDDAVVDAVMGEQYPVHRDADSLRDYVILRVAGEGQDEIRHFLDGEGSVDLGLRTQGSWDDNASPVGDDDDSDMLA